MVDFAELGITVKFDDVGRATVELDKLTTAGRKAESQVNALQRATTTAGSSSIAATRNMGAWAAIQAEAEGHVGSHSLAIGRLERAMEEMAASSMGANRVLSLVSTSLLKFGLGTVETVGILAGLAAVGFGYEKLTEQIREADKAQTDAANNALSALRAHAAGPGGSAADNATGAYAEANDVAQHAREQASFMEALKKGSFMSFDFNPANRADRVQTLQNQADLLNLAGKWAEMQAKIASARQFASSVATPFDYARTRGESLDGFYTQAMASERQLSALAKSGTFEVRDAAIEALGKIEQILDRIKLIRLGLAEAPSRLLGLPSDVALGGFRSTLGNIQAGVNAPGGSLSAFGGRVDNLGDLLSRASQQATGSSKTQIDQLLRELTILAEGQALAGAAPGDRESIAANIRAGHRATGDPFAINAAAQAKYSEDLAVREAALRLPDAFDATREAAVRLGEAMRTSHEKLALGLAAFGITSTVGKNGKPDFHFSKGAIKDGAAAGAEGALGDALMQFSPQGLAYAAVSSGINYIVSGFEQMAISIFDGGASAREAARAFRELTDQYLASAAAFRRDDLGAALAQDAAQFEQLIKQTQDTLGDVFTLVTGGRAAIDAYTGALKDQAAQEARNQALIVKQAAEAAQYRQEDLVVRNLRAIGHGSEADVLAFKEQQQREYTAAYDKALADGLETAAEALYLNTLRTTQNNELLAFLNGTLQDAMRNSPSGFFANNYYSEFATPRGSDPSLDSGISRPTIHTPGAAATASPPRGVPGTTNNTTLNVSFVVDGTKSAAETTQLVVGKLKEVARSIGGDSVPLSDALDRLR